MKNEIRLDKFLADMGVGTRSEVKAYVKKGRITIGDEVIKKPEYKVKIDEDKVFFDGNPISYVTYEYYMLNKPAGVISATSDPNCKTVVDLIEDAKRKDLFPVGRLDKDTEGLLLLTNDGDLAHSLLSPKKHVDKVYYAKIAGKVTGEDVEIFEQGVVIDEDFTAMPANLTILKAGDISEIQVTIREGKFHQVKRMFEAVNKEVLYLKRLSMGTLVLNPKLELGEYRPLTEEELSELLLLK